MASFDDILHEAPWEARSVNGPLHDRVDWLAAGEEGFPLAVKRLSVDDQEKSSSDAQGMWGYFELGGNFSGSGPAREVNRWNAGTLGRREDGDAETKALRNLTKAARSNRFHPHSNADSSKSPGAKARTLHGEGDDRLKTLRALRDAARKGNSPDQEAMGGAGPCKGDSALKTGGSSELSILKTLRDSLHKSEDAEPPGRDTAAARRNRRRIAALLRGGSGLETLRMLRDAARTRQDPGSAKAYGWEKLQSRKMIAASLCDPDPKAAPSAQPQDPPMALSLHKGERSRGISLLPDKHGNAAPSDNETVSALRKKKNPAPDVAGDVEIMIPRGLFAGGPANLDQTGGTAKARPRSPQHVAVVQADDQLATQLLRGCLLASARAKSPLPGLEEIISEQDLRECAHIVCCSYTVETVESKPPLYQGPFSSAPIPLPHIEAVFDDEPAAIESGFAHSPRVADWEPDTWPLLDDERRSKMEDAFAVVDLSNSFEVASLLREELDNMFDGARCVIVLTDPLDSEAWDEVKRLGSDGLDGAPRRTVSLFSVDGRIPRRTGAMRRFLEAWWKWFGSGSRSGFFELASQLDRVMGLLGLNLHQQDHDLAMVSIIASQLRDGGTIASADDIADALADRYPDRELLQSAVNAAMELLVREGTEDDRGRVFIPMQDFFEIIKETDGAPRLSAAWSALRSSPALQMLLLFEGERIEVRFSTMLACLAARWFLRDDSAMLLTVADALCDLAKHVPMGGWGRIVLQTVLLAEQRGKTFAARVILDRLHSRYGGDFSRRRVLVEISLGVFMDAAGGLPRIWQEGLFRGTVDSDQAKMIKEAHDAGWLREENLLVLRHAVKDLRKRALAGEDVGIRPERMLTSCHWMDLLLRSVDAEDVSELTDQIIRDISRGDADARVRALGRYDCLVWADEVNVALACPMSHHDAQSPQALSVVGDAAFQELSEEGPAYAECARLAWVFAMTPALFDEWRWDRIRRRAAQIVESTAGDDGEAAFGRRHNAYRVLYTYAMWKDRMEQEGCEIDPGMTDPLFLSPRSALQMAQDELAVIKGNADGDKADILLAQAAFDRTSPSAAKAAVMDVCDLSGFTTLDRQMILLFSPNLERDLPAGGQSRSAEMQGSDATPRDPQRAADLRERWRRVSGALLPTRT